MACPYTVRQVISIFRQYANNSTDPLVFDKAGLIKALTDFEFVDTDTGAMAKINLLGATEIANEFVDLYGTWLKNVPKSDQLQRVLDRTMQSMGNLSTIELLVQQEIDYMLLFGPTSETIKRGERLEVALMKIHQKKDFNANIMKENFYSTLLNSISFIKGMIIDNVAQSFFRKILSAYQMKQVPDFNFKGAGEFARTIFNDVLKGGVPINTVMEQELRGTGVFSKSVRTSEYGSEPSKRFGAYLKWAAFSTKWTQRINNAPDSVGQSMAMERAYFVYLNKVIDKQMQLNNLSFGSNGEVMEITKDYIKIKDLDKNKVFTLHLTNPSKLKENRLKQSPSAWQKQFQIAAGDYTYTVNPNLKVGSKVGKELIARFKLTDAGKAKQMEGQGYYYDMAGATQAAEEMYQRAGIMVVDKGPDTDYQINRNSPRFKRSVFEMQRQGRNMAALEAAEKTAIHDFFKNPMGVYKDVRSGVPNYLEIPNQGIFGGVAAGTRIFADFIMPALSNTMVKIFASNASPQKQEQFQTLFRVGFFGFVNGANAYAENLLEYSPYGLLKYGMMKAFLAKSDKEMLTEAEKMFYDQRLTDLIAKPTITFLATGLVFALKMAAEESGLCDGSTEPSLEDVKNGNFVICGRRIPSWMFGMGRTWLGLYNWMLHNDKGRGSIALLAFLSGGRYADRTTGGLLNEYLYAQSADQAQGKLDVAKKLMVQSITDVLALHLPGKGLIGSNSLFFPDKEVEPTLESWPQIFKWSTLQSIGMKEAVLSATGEYNVVDYFGRQVLNNPLKYQIGDGIKYDKYDDLINKLSLDGKDLYNGRYRKLFSDESAYSQMNYMPRFMTEKEFHHVQKATGELFREFMERNYETLQSLPVEDEVKDGYIFDGQKSVVRGKLKEFESASKLAAEFIASQEFEAQKNGSKFEADEKFYKDLVTREMAIKYENKKRTFENWRENRGKGEDFKMEDPLKEEKKTSVRQVFPKAPAQIPYY